MGFLCPPFSDHKEDIAYVATFYDIPACVLEIVSGDTCYSISVAYKTNVTELGELNGGTLDCNNLLIGRRLCVWSGANDRPLSHLNCTEVHSIVSGDTCWSLTQAYGITVDELQLLNPQMNCSSLQIGSDICVKDSETKVCSKLVSVGSGSTCADIAAENGISLNQLSALNPTLRCERMDLTQQVCTGLGYYDTAKCVSSIRVVDTNTTCQTIVDSHSLSMQELLDLNPHISCGGTLAISHLVCIGSFGGFETRYARMKFLTTLETVSPILLEQYQIFEATPTKENSRQMALLIMQEIQKPAVYAVLKTHYASDSELRSILDSGLPSNRTSFCERMATFQVSQAVKDCYCDDNELMLYCQMKLNQELSHLFTSVGRKKRQAFFCELQFPFLREGRNTRIHFEPKCIGAGCEVVVGPLTFGLETNMCVPPISIVENVIKYCAQDESCAEVDGLNSAAVKAIIEEAKLGAEFKMCITGSKWLEMLSAFDNFVDGLWYAPFRAKEPRKGLS
ncbi:hypothetical protein Y032_0213g2287 [Ancylostoma ceylanicum]|uniref:LysM domain-containing protein n=1 Tax=Ancylostoma ceylanicum TaxID=53326 RepID=A0A016SKF9_9BILA|nr:hypothetical protein Y032_0213g2287 [Ancylostoma ceylanicum]